MSLFGTSLIVHNEIQEQIHSLGERVARRKELIEDSDEDDNARDQAESFQKTVMMAWRQLLEDRDEGKDALSEDTQGPATSMAKAEMPQTTDRVS
ncbi:hypothetical protein ACOMHN_023983 [Nucella lapillus]